MGEDTNQIEQEIRERRTDLGRNLEQLGDKARELADWRTHYRSHSAVFLGAAFGAGLLIGLKAIPSAHRTDHVHFLAEPDTSHDPYPGRQVGGWAPKPQRFSRARRQLGDTWEQIADGLLKTASVAVVNLVSDLVPGFSDQIGSPSRTPVKSR